VSAAAYGSGARIALDWAAIEELAAALAEQLAERRFDAILAVARGGLVPASLVAQRLGVREMLSAAVASYDGTSRGEQLSFLAFPPDAQLRGRRIAIIDDIWDSGRTATAVRERVRAAGGDPIVAVLHVKPARNAQDGERPDLAVATTDAWIDYPWERFGRG